MKRLILKLFLVVIAILVINLTVTPTHAESEIPFQSIIEKYAPILMAERGDNMKSQIPLKYDFDGDKDFTNNLDNMNKTDISALKPVAYVEILVSETHILIPYFFFYAYQAGTSTFGYARHFHENDNAVPTVLIDLRNEIRFPNDNNIVLVEESNGGNFSFLPHDDAKFDRSHVLVGIPYEDHNPNYTSFSKDSFRISIYTENPHIYLGTNTRVESVSYGLVDHFSTLWTDRANDHMYKSFIDYTKVDPACKGNPTKCGKQFKNKDDNRPPWALVAQNQRLETRP